MKTLLKFLAVYLLFSTPVYVDACTNYLVSKGASADGSTMVSYAADSHIRYGELYFSAAADWPEGSMLTIFDRSTAKPLGQIPQVAHTYQTLGFMNEFQVSMGETTFGGRPELVDSTGVMDYAYLMFVALQRSRTAREAIQVIAQLVEQHGYASSGESFSIGDPNEVWIMEIVGKGVDMQFDKKKGKQINRNRGAVWVAMRIPDGYVSAHANQSRITTFQLADGKISINSKQWDKLLLPEIQCIYAHDVIDFAIAQGYYKKGETPFSFCDAYAPVSFDALRFCELRVWSMFNHVADGMKDYWDYATGNVNTTRMPLFVKPNRKLTPQDLMSFKRDHLQGTELDMALDAGAGPFGLPYRWRPLTWKYQDKEYFHERVTVTQQTGFSFIAQMRSWLPNAIGGIFWFGVDDAGSTVYVPFYTGITGVPEKWGVGYGDILTYKEDAAFWVFTRVAHLAYLFYDRVMPDVRKAQAELENSFAQEVVRTDQEALLRYNVNPEAARAYLTEFSTAKAGQTLEKWQQLFGFLLVKYMDGNVKQEKDGQFLRNPWGYPASPKHPGYDEAFKARIIEDKGERFLMPSGTGH